MKTSRDHIMTQPGRIAEAGITVADVTGLPVYGEMYISHNYRIVLCHQGHLDMEYDSQQAVNEVFATLLHSRQPNAPEYVSYKAMPDPHQKRFLLSLCETFVEPGLEFLPAYEIGTVQGFRELSDYDKYIKAWAECGMDETQVREFLDYQTITDFIISNVDRHLANFGALRRADTLEFVKPAPIYDSGNSMFFSETNV